MDSIQVRNSIARIYDRFTIPSGLRLHMYRVASVAGMICDNLNGVSVNSGNVVAACLLHDLGNIVKFEISKDQFPGLLGADGKGIDYWQEVKKKVIARYGGVDHVATHNMLSELGVDSRLILIIDSMGGIFNGSSTDMEADICSYSDCRVGPSGVMSVTDRVNDFYKRYMISSDPALRARALELRLSLSRILDVERRIFSDARIRPEQINDKSIKPYLDRYMKR
jgi:hypothetical protein